MVILFLPCNLHIPNDVMIMRSRLCTCVCWWSIFSFVITGKIFKESMNHRSGLYHCPLSQDPTVDPDEDLCSGPPYWTRGTRGSSVHPGTRQDPPLSLGANWRVHCWPSNSLTPVRMAVIKKTRDDKCQRGCGEKGTFLYCWWKCNWVHPLWKTACRFLEK